jgi:hypothetical protein
MFFICNERERVENNCHNGAALAGIDWVFFVKNILHMILPSCRDVSELQARAFTAPLPFSKRLGLRLHLLVCGWCRRYGRQISFLREAVEARPEKIETNAPHSLPKDARARLKKSLSNVPK